MYLCRKLSKPSLGQGHLSPAIQTSGTAGYARAQRMTGLMGRGAAMRTPANGRFGPKLSGDQVVHTRSPVLPHRECRSGRFSAIQPFLKPVQHFFLYPSHSVGAQNDPSWEFSGLLQTCNVLRRVQNQLLQLALRQDPHRDLSMVGEHRDAQGYDNTRVSGA